ncbi:hypothetical protein FBUS_01949, partial [Fasciolopsis buskii]
LSFVTSSVHNTVLPIALRRAVESASRATANLTRMNELLKSALFNKLQLDYAQKQRANLEMGVDAITILEDTVPVLSPIRPVNSQRISRLERPPSTGFEFPTTSAQRSLEVLFPSHSSNFPRVDNLVDDSSPTTVEVRQRTIDLTRRVLSTRSADFDGFHSELLFPDVTQSGVPEETHNRPVCENLPEFDSDGKLLPDIAPSDSN